MVGSPWQQEWPICQPNSCTKREEGFSTHGCWLLGTGMKARKIATFCVLLVAPPWLIACETTSRESPSPQFQKQAQRAQECRALQDKLAGDQPLTPERAAEIIKT